MFNEAPRAYGSAMLTILSLPEDARGIFQVSFTSKACVRCLLSRQRRDHKKALPTPPKQPLRLRRLDIHGLTAVVFCFAYKQV